MKKQLNFNKFLKNNSSTILTVVGSIGVGITAVISARDTVRAIKRIDKWKTNRTFVDECGHTLSQSMSKKEKIKIAAPCYIPTVISGVSTILCIFGANKLNKNTQESLASAYILLDQSYKEYRHTVKEVYGEDGELNIVKNIASKKIEEAEVVEEDDTDIFFDFFNLYYFNSSLSAIHEAVDAANEMLKMHGYVSMGTLRSFIGGDISEHDDALGWSIGAGKMYGYDDIQITITEDVTKDGLRYYILDYVSPPTEDYMRL